MKTSTQQTLAEVVHGRAAATGDQIAYTFLADGATDARSITWAQLDHRAGVLAAAMRGRGAAGQRVLLALPSGLAFVESLFACWYAGAIPVPVSLPRHQRVKHRLDRIVADAGATFAIGTAETRQRLDGSSSGEPFTAGLTWIDADAPEAHAPVGPTIDYLDIALLQYTSGSTGAPRGVVVTHANLTHNSALIAEALGHTPKDTIAGWLPLFHDMGLVGGVVQSAFSGARCVLMAPERFLMRPRLWLQMISDYSAVSSPAPNFAYDLCVDKIDDTQKAGLDLSCWRNALNGSEPVRAATLDRFAAAFAGCGFRRSAFFPCYGLAESTLFVTGPREIRCADRRTVDGTLLPANHTGGHVACGRAFGDTQVAVVDTDSAVRVIPGSIGEIWVHGGSVATGYWNNAEATAATFDAQLDGIGGWLRTGDLGFVADGELFITGRLRDLIIVAGKNHFPVDIERTVEAADAGIAASGAAAFSVEVGGVERLVIAAELRRPVRGESPRDLDFDAVRRRIRAAVTAEHEVAVHDVVLLRAGALRRTTSGKISRRNNQDAYLENSLELAEGAVYAHA